jgi:drug/metabolite transporter (DMT)-like permease
MVMRKINTVKKMSVFAQCVTASVIFGTAGIATKIAVESMHPLVYGGLINLFIGLVLLLFIRNFNYLKNKRVTFNIIVNSFLMMLFIAFQTTGIMLSGPLKASVLLLVTPIFMYFFSVILLHEPVIKRVIFGGTIALLGSLLLVGLPVLLGQSFAFGDVLLVSGYALVALIIIHMKYMFSFASPIELMGVRFTIAGAGLLAYVAVVLSPSLLTQGDANAWAMVAYGIVITGVIAHVLYYKSLSRMKAEEVAPLTYLEPMTGSVLAVFVLGESLGPASVTGVLIILVGVLVSSPHQASLFAHYHMPKKISPLGHLKRWLATHPL